MLDPRSWASSTAIRPSLPYVPTPHVVVQCLLQGPEQEHDDFHFLAGVEVELDSLFVRPPLRTDGMYD